MHNPLCACGANRHIAIGGALLLALVAWWAARGLLEAHRETPI